MQNRQKDEMIRDILSVSNGGASISQIMFKAYACHSQAKAYLAMLIDSGMVGFDTLDRKYYATPKGIEYLRATERMSELLPITTRRSVADKLSIAISQF